MVSGEQTVQQNSEGGSIFGHMSKERSSWVWKTKIRPIRLGSNKCGTSGEIWSWRAMQRDHAMLRSSYFFLRSIRQDRLNLLLMDATKLITSMFTSFSPPSASTIDKILIFLTVNPSPCPLPVLFTLSSPFTMRFAPLATLSSSESSFSPLWISPVNQPTGYSIFFCLKTLNLILYFRIYILTYFYFIVFLYSPRRLKIICMLFIPKQDLLLKCSSHMPICQFNDSIWKLGYKYSLSPAPSVFLIVSLNYSTNHSDVQPELEEPSLITSFSSPSFPVYQ